MAEQALRQAETNLGNAKSQLRRTEELFRNGFIGQAAPDDSRREVALADSQVRSTRKQLEAMRSTGSDFAMAEASLAQARASARAAHAGYGRFSLGMAPLAGLEAHPLAPLWHRVGTLIYRHGEHFHNFQGPRAFKQKFDPQWQPRYLAGPDGVALPGVLLDVAALIGGGLSGVVTR